MDLEPLWEYSDPVASETRFRERLAEARGDDRIELLTQVARALGLQRRFEEAEDVLGQIESELAVAGPAPRARWLLEKGRVANSRGEPERARPLFAECWEFARRHGLEGLAVDAGHMVAITLAGTEEGVAWSRRALELARGSRDTKAWALIPAILNNLGWDLHDLGRYDEALHAFEWSLEAWTSRGSAERVRIARWSVARALRSLGRHEEALRIQLQLETECREIGVKDGHVFQEIAENLAAMGREGEAMPWREQARAVLERS